MHCGRPFTHTSKHTSVRSTHVCTGSVCKELQSSIASQSRHHRQPDKNTCAGGVVHFLRPPLPPSARPAPPRAQLWPFTCVCYGRYCCCSSIDYQCNEELDETCTAGSSSFQKSTTALCLLHITRTPTAVRRAKRVARRRKAKKQKLCVPSVCGFISLLVCVSSGRQQAL